MMAFNTAEIVASISILPSLPAVVREVQQSLEQGDVTVSSLAATLGRDPALAAKVLRLSNSSFYGLSGKVGTVQQAIMVLGLDSVRTLVSDCGMISLSPAVPVNGFDLPTFWRHSLGTAICARILARYLNRNQDQAFSCALLHDIGTLVLAIRYPQQYQKVRAYRTVQNCPIAQAERAVLGFDHAYIGSLLADRWNFPLPMQRAMAAHHAPDNKEAGDLPGIVHLADAIAHGTDFRGRPDELTPLVAGHVWQALSISPDDVQRELLQAEPEFKEVRRMMAPLPTSKHRQDEIVTASPHA